MFLIGIECVPNAETEDVFLEGRTHSDTVYAGENPKGEMEEIVHQMKVSMRWVFV